MTQLLIKSHIGGKEYKKFLDKKFLTKTEAILAQCYHCTGAYDGGTGDCQGKSCPLYFYMPYRTNNDVPQAPPPSEKVLAAQAAGAERFRNRRSLVG